MRRHRTRCLKTSQTGPRSSRRHCLRGICPYQSRNSMHLHWAMQLAAWKAWRNVSVSHKVKQKPAVLQKPNACARILLHGERGSPVYGWVSSVATLVVPEELLLSSANTEPAVRILATCLTPLSVPFDYKNPRSCDLHLNLPLEWKKCSLHYCCSANNTLSEKLILPF